MKTARGLVCHAFGNSAAEQTIERRHRIVQHDRGLTALLLSLGQERRESQSSEFALAHHFVNPHAGMNGAPQLKAVAGDGALAAPCELDSNPPGVQVVALCRDLVLKSRRYIALHELIVLVRDRVGIARGDRGAIGLDEATQSSGCGSTRSATPVPWSAPPSVALPPPDEAHEASHGLQRAHCPGSAVARSTAGRSV